VKSIGNPVLSALFVMLAGAVMPLAHAQKLPDARPPKFTAYVVRPNDTLFDLSVQYLQDPLDWIALRDINHVADPRRLATGSTLSMPTARLRQRLLVAKVIAVRGAVSEQPANGERMPLLSGVSLQEGDEIDTGGNAFVSVLLTDGSRVVLPSNSRVKIARLRETLLTGALERQFDLKAGEASAEVTPFIHPRDTFRIVAPSVVAGVRGTRFRVNYLADRNATVVEVLAGHVAVTPESPTLSKPTDGNLLAAGYGNVTRTGDAAGAAIKLLSAPELVDPTKSQHDEKVAFDLVPVAGAAAYRVEIATDAAFLDLIGDHREVTPHASFENVPEGDDFVRVSATDADGIDGEPQVYTFERWQDRTHAVAARLEGNGYAFRWLTAPSAHFRFILSTHPDLQAPLVDLMDVTGGQVIVSDLPSGHYYWTVIVDELVGGVLKYRVGEIRSFTSAR